LPGAPCRKAAHYGGISQLRIAISAFSRRLSEAQNAHWQAASLIYSLLNYLSLMTMSMSCWLLLLSPHHKVAVASYQSGVPGDMCNWQSTWFFE
jgi:hypothetical protein